MQAKSTSSPLKTRRQQLDEIDRLVALEMSVPTAVEYIAEKAGVNMRELAVAHLRQRELPRILREIA